MAKNGLSSWRTKDAEIEDKANLKQAQDKLENLNKRRSNTETLFGKETAKRSNSVFGYNPSQEDIDEAASSVKVRQEDENEYNKDRYSEYR